MCVPCPRRCHNVILRILQILIVQAVSFCRSPRDGVLTQADDLSHWANTPSPRAGTLSWTGKCSHPATSLNVTGKGSY